MTKQQLLLIILLLTTCSFVYGQTELQRIKTKPGAVLTKVLKEKGVLLFFTGEKEILKKPKTFEVIKLARIKDTIPYYYDAYIIDYKKSLYWVENCFVLDNYILDEANIIIKDNYNRKLQMQRELQMQRKRKRKRDTIDTIQKNISNLEQKILELENKINRRKTYIEEGRFDDIKRYEADLNINTDSLSRVIQKRIDSTIISKLIPENEQYKALSSKLQKFVRTIRVMYNKLDSPNSAGGCDFDFYYCNLCKKTIKYFDWSGYVYNAVGDRVVCEIDRTSYASGRDTGPHEFLSTEGGGTWSNIIYNHSARTLLITSINISYMDGTSYGVSLSKADWALLDAYASTNIVAFKADD